MLMLHQVLPHNHHQHERIDVVEASEHHHSHDHNHDHDKEENKESNDHSGFLDFLLDSHSHTYHSTDFQVRNEIKAQIQVKQLSSFVLPEFDLFSFAHHPEKIKPVPRFTTGYHHPYLSTLSLRGPPILG